MFIPHVPTVVADAGIPMIMLTLPAMLLLLIPVIVVEGLLCRKWLGWSTGDAMKLNAASNLVSTLVGVPIAWGVMLLLEIRAGAALYQSEAFQNWKGPLADVVFILLGAAWFAPSEDSGIWMIPAATLVLLVPFFFASYWSEYYVIRTMLGRRKEDQPRFEPSGTKIAVRNANLVTYGAMFLATSVWLLVALFPHKKS